MVLQKVAALLALVAMALFIMSVSSGIAYLSHGEDEAWTYFDILGMFAAFAAIGAALVSLADLLVTLIPRRSTA